MTRATLLGLQPRLGAPPAVVGQMGVRPLLALDRERQPVGRRVEIDDPQDGVARLGLGLDGGAHGIGSALGRHLDLAQDGAQPVVLLRR